jgi:hypothetical protein
MLMFSSFNAWRSHELDHRREWFCPICGIPCKDETKAHKHLTKHHGDVSGSYQIDMLLRTSSRPPEFLSAKGCPFCDWNSSLQKRNTASQTTDLVVPSRRFMKHLGKHLEELALFVIPLPDEEDGDPDEVDSNAVHAAHMGDSESVSTLSSFRSTPSLTNFQEDRQKLHSLRLGADSNVPAFASQQANAMQLQETGTEVIPASYNPDPMFNGQANAQNGQPGGIDPAMFANDNAQGGHTRDQMQSLVMQREKLRQEQIRSTAHNAARAQAMQQAQHNGQNVNAIGVETDPGLVEATRCVCGQQGFPGLPHRENDGASNAQDGDAGGLFVQCDSCYVWQHGGCIGMLDESQSPDVYYCELCRPEQHKVHWNARGDRCSIYTSLTPAIRRPSHRLGMQSQNDSHSESFNCPVNTCKRHTGKGLSRISGLVKHLAAVHGITKTAADIRWERKNSLAPVHDYNINRNEDAPYESIACICGIEADDGNAIACGTCKRWAHAVCYYPQHDDTLTDELQHTCIQCRPDQSVDSAAARLHQSRRLQQLEGNDSSHPSPTTQSHATSEMNATMGTSNPQLLPKDMQLPSQLAVQQQELPWEVRPDQVMEQAADMPAPIPSHSGVNMNHKLPDFQIQLMLLEQQNKKRLLMNRQAQDSMPAKVSVPSNKLPLVPEFARPSPSFAGSDEARNVADQAQPSTSPVSFGGPIAQSQQDDKPPEGGHPCFMEECVGLGNFGTNDLIAHLTVVHGFDEHVATNYAQSLHTANLALLQDYQMQLMLPNVHKPSFRFATQHEQGSFRSEPTTTLPELHVHEYQPPADVKCVAPSVTVAIDSISKNYVFVNQTPGNLDKGKKAAAPASGTAENDQITRLDQTVHPEVTMEYNDELYNPKVTAMYAGVDTRKANAETVRKNWPEDGERLPGVQSIVEGPWKLQSESSLERATLASSSNSYDKRLLTKMGGPPVSQGSGKQQQAVPNFRDQGSPPRDQFSSDSIAYNDGEYVLDDLMSTGAFEDTSKGELDRLIHQVCCRIIHCL